MLASNKIMYALKVSGPAKSQHGKLLIWAEIKTSLGNDYRIYVNSRCPEQPVSLSSVIKIFNK